jgi:hypothetical protein
LPAPAQIVSGEVPGMADVLGRSLRDPDGRKRRGRKPRLSIELAAEAKAP